MTADQDFSDVIYAFWTLIAEGTTFDDAYAEYEDILEEASITASEYLVEYDIDLDAITINLAKGTIAGDTSSDSTTTTDETEETEESEE